MQNQRLFCRAYRYRIAAIDIILERKKTLIVIQVCRKQRESGLSNVESAPNTYEIEKLCLYSSHVIPALISLTCL